MKTGAAIQIGRELIPLLLDSRVGEAYHHLSPILSQKIPFPALERIGLTFGEIDLEEVNPFLKKIASEKTMGGWVIIAGALQAQLDRDLKGAFEQAKEFTITADVWYGADIFGERVPGPGLVSYFDQSINLIHPWGQDQNRWIRRMVGVSVHFWAKRSRGRLVLLPQAETLLLLLEPMFSEWEMDAVKGIGWGLKTLGKYYPDLVADWLPGQLGKKHRAIMFRKAVTYLGEERRKSIEFTSSFD